MKRPLVTVGVVLAVATVVLLWWTKERRNDDEYECALNEVRDLSAAGCDVMSWWPVIVLGALTMLMFVVASKVQRPSDV